MAVTNTAAFGQVPRILQAIVTAAKAAPLGTTNTNAVSMGGVGLNGTIINGIAAIPMNTLGTAAHIAVYYSTDSGTTLNIVAIGLLAPWTFAATTAPTPLNLTNLNGSIISITNPLYIPYSATTLLYASTSVAPTTGIMVTANGIDL